MVIVMVMFGASMVYQIQNQQAQATRIAIPTLTVESLMVHYQKGIGYINIEQWSKAEEELDLVFEIDPNYKDVQAKLREVYGQLKLNGKIRPLPSSTAEKVNLPKNEPSLTDGLIAYYPFSRNANDESGHGHHGVVHGAILVSDRFGVPNSAYNFDGIDDYIEIPDDDELDLTPNLTISAWILQKNIRSEAYRIVDKETAGTADGYHLDTYGLALPNCLRTCGRQCVSANTAYTLHEWHHVVLIISGVTATFYLDGKPDGGGSIKGEVQVNSLELFIGGAHVGCDNSCGTREFFNGIIDDVSLYNQALSEAEVQRLYNTTE